MLRCRSGSEILSSVHSKLFQLLRYEITITIGRILTIDHIGS